MLKATGCILTGLTVLGIGLAVGQGQAGQISTTVGWATGSMLVTQVGSSDKKAQAEDLLHRARQALAENDFAAAEQLVAQAERLGVAYGPMTLGDTPERVRRDMELKRAAASKRSGSLLPLPFRKSEEPSDPFAVRNRSGAEDSRTSLADHTEESMSMLPPVDQVNAVPPPSGGVFSGRTGLGPSAHYDPAGRNADRTRSDELLIAARRALALGDVRRANNLVQQARELNVHYTPNEDSPTKVEMAIRQYEDLVQQPGDRRQSEPFRRQYAKLLLEQAEALAAWQQYAEAERLALEASRLGVTYGPFEPRPENLLRQIDQARRQQRSAVQLASGQFPVSQAGGGYEEQRASQALYDPRQDTTRNVWAGAMGQPGPDPANSAGMALFRQGEDALRNRDTETAVRLFRQAAEYRHELDPVTAQRLQDYLQLYSAPSAANPSMIDEAVARQQTLLRQVHADVAHQESTALRLRETDPRGALALLEETRKRIEATAGLDPNARAQLLRRIDRNIELTRKYIEENRSRIELEEQNRHIEEEVTRTQLTKLEVQQKLASMVDEYNRLMDEQRFAEAEVLAKRAYELDPDSPVTVQLVTQSKFIRRFFNNLSIQDNKERSFVDRLSEVDASMAVPVGDRNPLVFPDAKEWAQLTKTRSKYLADRRRGMSERELEIEQKLKTPVTLDFKNAPLSTVMEYLAKLADVNLHLDPQGLAEEGVTTDTPITVSLTHEVSLKSALNLILQPLHLSYVIKDEVLKITSEQARSGEVYTVSYPVADLVIPIPNFTPNPRMGLAGAYHDALGAVGYGGMPTWAGASGSPLAVVASRDGTPSTGMISPAILAQMQQATGGANATTKTPRSGMPLGFGPGGLGGGVEPDFDSLIDLIIATVKPQSWSDAGGPGSIMEFETNLSIVVSQTQEVHEEIADLLEQLRRLQDLQVTIEVRFVTLMDNFFERIGVDFDFDINDNNDRPFQIFGRKDPTVSTQYPASGAPPQTYEQDYPRNTQDRDLRRSESTVAGLNTAGAGINLGNFSADLDIPFRQDSFALTIPQYGGFPAGSNPGAQIGFAILSEIEAFFFIEAAQGDTRTNILQAPKVTLFNGQQAFVSDTSQSPFVISVIPVVGDFAAAQQPVIVVLNEGTFMTVQAVVSNDRRFVRLTIVPFFSRIDEVNTFTFTGSETTSEESSSEGNQETPNDNSRKSDSRTVTRQGTTVQLPTFSFVTVTTTVSVPDGGTVLLGGIKRLNEQRREFGVPMLNKIPYVNRLFRNVGIGRETSSLLMMVTPRIIIQEEEEERLGILP